MNAENPETAEDVEDVGKPVVRRREQVPLHALAPGVTVAEMLNDEHGCLGLHQRRLRLAGRPRRPSGVTMAATAAGRGEAWYVIRGSGVLDAGAAGSAELQPGTAVWLGPSVGYRCQGDLEILAITVRADAAEDRPGRPCSSRAWTPARSSAPATGSSGCC